MKKFIPIELSLAERLVAAQLENPFCGFCRTERAAVEELKVAMTRTALSPTGRLPSQPELQDIAGRRAEGMEPVPTSGAALIEADFAAIEARVAAHLYDYDEGGLERLAISQMPGPARQPVDYDELQRLISEVHASPGECTWDELDKAAGSAIEDILLDRYQLQATIKEMGELIDQQAAELEQLRKLTAGATLTHKTKGGYYRPLGEAAPAGAAKTLINVELSIYQDTHSGKLYYRSTHDFAAALEPL